MMLITFLLSFLVILLSFLMILLSFLMIVPSFLMIVPSFLMIVPSNNAKHLQIKKKMARSTPDERRDRPNTWRESAASASERVCAWP